MFKSMTAFAVQELTRNAVSVAVEMRAYNSRHLDIVLRLASAYQVWEERIKRRIGERVVRGRVEVRVQVNDQSTAAVGFTVDWAKARAYLSAVRELKKRLKLPAPVTWDRIAAVPGVMQAVENPDAATANWPLAEECLGQALEALNRMREEEGAYLLKDLYARLHKMEEGLARIAAAAGRLPEQYRCRLQERLDALLQGNGTVDPLRLAQEVAFLADRSDISEEIVRTGSHLQQFRVIVEGREAAGRKLNFLLQELNREFNTMGAKVAQVAIAHDIVDLKAEIEKLREQVQNSE